ncbi:sigma-70 family RNA polymerase sigma factor [Clostridium sp. 19966]|uniref:sigma-70 family RNA polymerase sigma factor n=1 Tax=Clostridium sp. 19966 TaxID=2768166 RepID=UPI0028E6AE8F|nr:sigma-70 family RNA polymerase sigma factor [Clostridium sp. 19966]
MNISGLKNPQFFKTWITKILINCAVAKLRKSNKIIYTNEYENMNDGNDISENEFDISKNIDLYNAIDRLNIKYKNIIILKYFQDMTISQISKLLNYPEGTIKVYLRRALKKLKIELKEECI